MTRRTKLCLAVLVAVTAFVPYIGALTNGFIWDDPIVLEQQMMAFKSARDVFVPTLDLPQFGVFYYRPLGVITYLIDAWFAGPRPLDMPPGQLNPFHVSVVLYHVLACVLLWFFGLALFEDLTWGAWAALTGAMLFAVHPIHTESVCWMAGRSDVLAALWVIPALTAYLTGWRKRRLGYFILAAALMFLGLLCKETSVAMLLALPILDLFCIRRSAIPAPPGAGDARAPVGTKTQQVRQAQKKTRGRTVTVSRVRSGVGLVWRYLPFVAALFLYWSLRRADLGRGDQGHGLLSLMFSVNLQGQRPDIAGTLSDLQLAIGYYVQRVFLPVRLNAFVADVPGGAGTMALGAAAITASAVMAARSWRGRGHVFVLAGLFWATLAPSLAIAVFSISETPVAERYLYLPSLAVCLGAGLLGVRVVSWAVERLSPRSARAVAAGTVLAGSCLAVVFGAAAASRNPVWKNDESFWADAVLKAPRQGLPHLHLGLAYDRKADVSGPERQRYEQLAEEQFLIALDEKQTVYDAEGRSIALNNLGNIYIAWREYAKASDHFQRAIAMRPNYATPYYGMALVEHRQAFEAEQQGKHKESWKAMERGEKWALQALNLNRNYTKAYLILGSIQAALRKPGPARASLQKVIELEPSSRLAVQAAELLKQIQTLQPASPAGG